MSETSAIQICRFFIMTPLFLAPLSGCVTTEREGGRCLSVSVKADFILANKKIQEEERTAREPGASSRSGGDSTGLLNV
jgi:hypothetical protein